MSAKQQWVYTEDGPELEKDKKKLSKLKLNKWIFLLPWALLIVLVIGLFSAGSSSATGWGVFFVIFGPMICLVINYYTIKVMVLNPLKKQSENIKPPAIKQ